MGRMKSKKKYEMQRKQARKWAIEYIADYLYSWGIEPTEENIRKYALARRRTLKQFHRTRGHLLG